MLSPSICAHMDKVMCNLVCYLPHLPYIESLDGTRVCLRTDVVLSVIFPSHDDRILLLCFRFYAVLQRWFVGGGISLSETMPY